MSNDFSIEAVLKLAKLDLSAKEKAVYEKQFPGILNYVAMLQKIKLPEAKLENTIDPQAFSRSDSVNELPEGDKALALKQAGSYKEGKMKVNKVL